MLTREKESEEGARKFSDATGRLIRKYIGIFLDDECISAPMIVAKIDAPEAWIQSNFSRDAAGYISSRINAGVFPAELTVVPAK